MSNRGELARIREQVDFLGYEFLSWLFLFLDHEKSQAELVEITDSLIHNTKVSVVLGERLVTCLFAHKEQKTSVVSPILESSHEVFASIKNGHLIESLSIMVTLGEIKVSLMLHAQDFAFTQVKIKNNFDEDSLTDQNEELDEGDMTREEIFLRTNALKDVERVVDALFSHFIDERFHHKNYKECLISMRMQVENRLGSYLQIKPLHGAEDLSFRPM